MDQATTVKPQTAFDMLGGAPLVRRIVDRFYDLMDADPQYAELRQLHAAVLDPMRDSLTGFLIAWLGGPKDWFKENPGKCMISAHRDVGMTPQSARQWADAMTRAIDDCVADRELGPRMAQALADMAIRMGGMRAAA